ncbi:hypothetical protein K443DRAFT_686738 [Laccaria amethystina LaAM-08-1]|uniref:Uncharacterized protein n=1 Tax=Laccaria amethystina LaAM-08-1 TaxID=1095629 RepID=A0A0C9WRH8_9AGAR|nr:hypothetical protein K443DRAFT_686738 [Laccaria amethystina LaAM-08-1]
MASVTYGIQAVRVASVFNFVLLTTFHRPVGQTISPDSCNTFIPVSHPQVTRDRRQTETRLWWSPFGFYVRNRLVAELLIMHPTVHLACHTPTRLSTTNDIDNVFTVRRRGQS